MAALAPLSGASHATGVVPLPGNFAPLPGSEPAVAPSHGAGFTAFPSSYGNFGNDQVGYGTVGIKNGAITVISSGGGTSSATANPAPSAPDPPQNAGPGSSAATGSPPATPPADPPAADPPGDPPLGSLPSAIPPPPPIPIASLPPQPIPETPGLNPPTLGEPQPPLPGPFAASEGGQNAGPDPIQQAQADQEAAAQQAQAQQASAQAARDEQLTTALQDVSFRLSAAYGEGNQGEANQLTPIAVQINGELQNQPFAGVGTTPPQPFAAPEVPTVFLNVPA